MTTLSTVHWLGNSGKVHDAESVGVNGNGPRHRRKVPLVTVAGVLTAFTAAYTTSQQSILSEWVKEVSN